MVGKKVIIVMGSPRMKGNSIALAHKVADGAKDGGAEVECFYLHKMNIKPCDACDVCQREIEKDCHIKDDMAQLYPKLRQADALVIASPIYYWAVNAQTKLFIDRFYALEAFQQSSLKGKQIGIVLTYGGKDPYESGAVNALRSYQDMFRYIGARIVGEVYGSASKPGEITSNNEVMEKAYRLGKRLAKQVQ
jgi:multimeric flavodoxin WrbA